MCDILPLPSATSQHAAQVDHADSAVPISFSPLSTDSTPISSDESVEVQPSLLAPPPSTQLKTSSSLSAFAPEFFPPTFTPTDSPPTDSSSFPVPETIFSHQTPKPKRKKVQQSNATVSQPSSSTETTLTSFSHQKVTHKNPPNTTKPAAPASSGQSSQLTTEVGSTKPKNKRKKKKKKKVPLQPKPITCFFDVRQLVLERFPDRPWAALASRWD